MGKNYQTLFNLERELGWKGILCEPNRSYQGLIRENRPNNILITEPLFSRENEIISFTELEGGKLSIKNYNVK